MDAGGGGGQSRVQGGPGAGGDEKPTPPWGRDRRDPPAGPEKEQELVSATAPLATAESRPIRARVTGGAGRHPTSRGRPASLRERDVIPRHGGVQHPSGDSLQAERVTAAAPGVPFGGAPGRHGVPA